ncbi:hypothetical protein PHYPO_G00146730 [Pangasianodon hypophthalmus]|uniref:Gypsy retrotransposon integrase-like protein 1 n=1 Tax=Pangasianodon hypophthalmus TaxID=310915 RepID=A0A5N5KCX2_PANHP|nr:hypothetical protein PHYPO_G00146730 [Pangasianodon hypophthalmus]
MVMTSLHNDMGHLDFDRTLDLTRSRFFWPRMANDVEKWIKSCSRCVCRKALPEKAAPLVNIQVSRPLELVCMDFLSIEPDRSNTKDVLVITDFFTKYAVAIPTPNQKARTVAKCLWENFIVHYGFPEKLHSDQGPDFESKTIKELCDLAGIHKVRTTPYHPRGNPVERFNRTILSMLGTLKAQEKTHWRDFVKPLVHAYNCTKHETTGFTPYELMFGWQPRLPIDLAFNVPLNQSKQKSYSQYVRALKDHLQESYQLARKNAAKAAERSKVRFDRRVTESTLGVGDRVLVRSVRLRGKHKLADKWEETVHVVVSRKGDLLVYTVKPENKDGPLRTLHRDLLLPCGFLSVPEEEPSAVAKPQRPSTRQHPHPDPDERQSEFNSDEEDDFVYSFQDPVFRTGRSTQEFVVPVPPREETSVEPTCLDPVVSSGAPGEAGQALLESSPSPSQHASEVKPMTTSDRPERDRPVEETESETVIADAGNLPEVQDGESTQELNDSETLESSETTHQNDTEIDERRNDQDENETQSEVRRPSRRRDPPKKLTYPELGNALVTIVQNLFQSLSSAITNSLVEPSLTPLPEPQVV